MGKLSFRGTEYRLPSLPQPFQNLRLEEQITDEPSLLRLTKHNKMVIVHVLNVKVADFLTGYSRPALSSLLDVCYLIGTSNNTVVWVTGKEHDPEHLVRAFR